MAEQGLTFIWGHQVQALMQHDPSLWLMMIHPGPPADPPGKGWGGKTI